MTSLAIVIAMLIVAGFFAVVTVIRNMHVCSPNEVLIFSGRRHASGKNTVGFRIVRGGRAVRIPVIETVSRMSLTNIPIELSVQGAFSRGGVPLNVVAVANVKIPSQEPLLHNALERFLGLKIERLVHVAKDTLEGCLRGVIAELSPEEINQQKKLFERKLNDEAYKDMQRLGLVLDNLQIQNISDDVGYLTSVGRGRGAEVRKEARIGEVRAQSQALVQKAANAMTSEVAKLEAQLRVLNEENRRRIVEAQTQREALIAEAQGEVLAQIAEAKAQVKSWEARAVQVQKRLEADIIAPATAEKAKLEAEARAQAAKLYAQGHASADALRRLCEAYAAGPNAARDALLMQKLGPVFNELLSTMQGINVQRLSVLPSSKGAAPALLSLNEQLKAATGLDLAARVAGSSNA